MTTMKGMKNKLLTVIALGNRTRNFWTLVFMAERTRRRKRGRTSTWDKNRFSNLETIDIWGWRILCCGRYPVSCGRFSSLWDPQNVNMYPPSHDNQKYLQTLPNVPWRAESPWVENHWTRRIILCISQALVWTTRKAQGFALMLVYTM